MKKNNERKCLKLESTKLGRRERRKNNGEKANGD